jgi:hypothetical protein
VKRRTLLLAVLALALALSGCDAGDPSRPEGGTTAAGPTRAGDLELLLEQIEAVHPDPYHAVSRADLHAAAAELAGRAGSLEEDEFLVELMRLTALLGERDGHSGIFPLDLEHRSELHLYPLRLYAFEGGLYVVDAVVESDLVGARLVSIDGVAIEEVAEAVTPLVPRDNELSLLARLPQYIVVAEILHGLGLTGDAASARLGFALPGGERRDVTLEPVQAEAYADAFGDLFDPLVPQGLPLRPAPAYLARRLEDRWLAALEGGRVVYAAYNGTLGDTSSFAREILRRVRDPQVERVVIDLRHNPGGNNSTYGPLLDALSDRTVDQPGRLVALVGRTTFSAAANFATELERSTGVVFVGESTGGSPNLYGDPVPVELPASGWTVRVASVYWRMSEQGDARVALEPAIAVALSSQDFFRGRDPVLTAALHPTLR